MAPGSAATLPCYGYRRLANLDLEGLNRTTTQRLKAPNPQGTWCSLSIKNGWRLGTGTVVMRGACHSVAIVASPVVRVQPAGLQVIGAQRILRKADAAFLHGDSNVQAKALHSRLGYSCAVLVRGFPSGPGPSKRKWRLLDVLHMPPKVEII